MLRFPWYKLKDEERIAAPILLRELGILDALRVGRRIRRRTRAGEPFAALPPPDGDDERQSREQVAPAILLYQELQAVVSRDRALSITEEIATEAGVIFLREQLGELRRDRIAQLDDAGRERFARERGARFFNATMRWDAITADEVRFTVTRCRFPRLCAEAGVPELSPVFCKVDHQYFGNVEPGVVLERPHTIAGGAASCPFTLRFADPRRDG